MTDWIRLPGQQPYASVHALQQRLLLQRIAGDIPDTVLLLEHAPTITVGRARNAIDNVLVPGDTPIVHVERGGDVTWHGPGQLVAYPIVDLGGRREDLHAHLHALEDAVIQVLDAVGLEATTDPRNTGVWLPWPGRSPQKVCSVGIACRRWVTWHGLALNVSPAIEAFTAIHPCGFDAGVMTRMCDHLQPCPTLESLVQPLADALASALGIAGGEVRSAPLDEVGHVPGPS